MQSRRDQVQAHMFVMGRLSAGMLRADPDIPDTPQRRTTRGFAIGLVVTVLIGLGTFLFGLVIQPGQATSWRADGSVVVERDTGARWLYVGGELHPVLNPASAKLVAGQRLAVHDVASSSLVGVPRGAPVGIPGAPDGLPAAGALSRDEWLSCAAPSDSGGRDFALLVGSTAGDPVTDRQGVLVSGPDGSVFLVWGGRKWRLDPASGGPAALGYTTADPVPVPVGLLNALPTGPDLVAPDVPGRGRPGPVLAGQPSTVGQLFVDARHRPYLLADRGLVPLTDTVAKLISGDPKTQAAAYGGQAVQPRMIGAGDITAHSAPTALRGQLTRGGLFPTSPPQLVSAVGKGVCAVTEPGAAVSTSVRMVPAAVTAAARPALPRPGVTPSCSAPGRVGIEPGSGALVASVATGGGAANALFLVADDGVKYPVGSDDALAALGYTADEAVRMPAMLVDQLATGPALDPAAAGRPVLEQPRLVPPRC